MDSGPFDTLMHVFPFRKITHTLNGQNSAASDLYHRDQTGIDRFFVQQDKTDSAMPFQAPGMEAPQVESGSENIGQSV
jgi:hypothetical protein